MIKKLQLTFLVILCALVVKSQTQTVRGKIHDLDSKATLPGASVIIYIDTTFIAGVTSDIDGNFKFENVELGRKKIRISFIGYKDQNIPLIVTSAKEIILSIELEESPTQLNQVEITASRKDQTINEMAIVSARTFAVEETERYAGSRGDPARMASNFAGVQGANDSRNDIVVRGNSPMGILWRLEGVDIPNPNHFAIAGTAGGPVGILNNKVLGNSDFMTGAFPAEYGNSISGVFDVKMRTGNSQKHEFTGQFGFLGTELTAEGPLSKSKGSSYLVNYRYSTLKMFESFNIKIGTSAVPSYQDAAFKINIPTAKGSISFFGVGGKSDIKILVSTYTEPQEEIYGDKNRDQYFGSSLGVIGASFLKQINSKTFSRLTLANSYNESHSKHLLVYRDSLFKLDSLVQKLGYKGGENKTTLAYSINHKYNYRHSFKGGFFVDGYQFNFSDSLYNENTFLFENRLKYNGANFLGRAYLQWKYKINSQLTFNSGIYAQYFMLNGSKSIEPRGGIRWELNSKHSVSFGAGMHSQMQPTYIYFHHLKQADGTYIMHNKNTGFTKSNHYVLSYDFLMGSNLRFKMETYFQNLYNVPVETQSSAYSVLNQGSGFTRFFPDSLSNKGRGKNYGFEFTLEKFFSKTFFVLATTSFYQSKYSGSDGVERNTDYNGRFAANLLFGKEIKVGKNNSVGFSNKITWAGGRRYTPVDIMASQVKSEAVYIDSLTNTQQLRNYFRTDFRLTFKINRNKTTHEIALDIVNLFNTKNVLALSYIPGTDSTSSHLREEYQLGLLPLFYYKIDF